MQIPAPPILIEGLRPSNSPTRALARRSAGSLRSRGSFAPLTRAAHRFAPRTPLLALSLAAPPAHSDREARSRRSLASQTPFALELPYSRSRSPLRRLTPIARLVRAAHAHRTAAPSTESIAKRAPSTTWTSVPFIQSLADDLDCRDGEAQEQLLPLKTDSTR